MNTLKTQAQTVNASESAISMYPGTTHDVSLDAGAETEILGVTPIIDNDAIEVEATIYGPLKWVFRILGIKNGITLTLKFNVTVNHNDSITEITVEIIIRISIEDDTALNVLQPELPISKFVIKQDEYLFTPPII